MLALPASALGQATAETGADLYQSACAACHGLDGRGAPRSTVGFETPLPDFTDCQFTTSEADVDWNAVVHLGGPARALDRRMPAFGKALSRRQIQSVIDFVRGFCRSRAWPHGNLNLPRPLATEKAFPENEVRTSITVPATEPDFVETRVVYERRLGPRSQYELAAPFTVQHAFGRWNRGLGDVTLGFKHVIAHSGRRGFIVGGGSDITFPTGKEENGLGHRLTVFEPFGTFSQLLPSNTFLHVQLGFEANGGIRVPLNLRIGRRPTVMIQVVWDWFEGGILSGW